MSFTIPKLLCSAAACSLAAVSLLAAAPAGAQPYDDRGSYDQYDQNTAQSGDLIVTAPPRQERSFNGAPIERVAVRRVVDTSDLDLSTGYGMHVLQVRVERAAQSACDELDNAWTAGYAPAADDTDSCVQKAVSRAMRHVEMEYSAND